MAPKPPGITKIDIMLRGTVIAAIVTGPSLAAFFVGWHLLEDPVLAAIIGGVVHFVALGFSLKIARRLFSRSAG